MSNRLEQPSFSYLGLVESHVQVWPGYKVLCKFLTARDNQYQQAAKITCVSIVTEDAASGTKNRIDFRELKGTIGLEEELLSSSETQKSCRLYVVENVCSRTISLLGGHFDVDPQFFVDHLNNDPWYRIADVGQNLPVLPSMTKVQEFLNLRCIEIRTIVDHSGASSSGNKTSAGSDDAQEISDNAKIFLTPDKATTRIPHHAGKIVPRNRWDQEGQDFAPLLCVRQVFSVWFQERKRPDEGWTGIILMYPSFVPPSKNTSLKFPEYRSFLRRPSLTDSEKETETRESNQKSFIQHLKRRFEGNESLLKAAKSNPFFILGDLYRIVASNWIVVNEYINRELSTIENILEKEEPSFRDLEIYLKDLYVYRRRCAKYYELISEAKEQCSRRGQKRWPRNSDSDLATEQGNDLEDDFFFLQSKTLGTVQRIEKNINLLTALVAIGEGKQQLEENHGIVRLSLVATVFLPFSTIAAILGMQGSYAPGSGRFWLFWAVAVPLTALVMGLSVLYDGFGKPVYRRLRKVWNLWMRQRNRILQEE